MVAALIQGSAVLTSLDLSSNQLCGVDSRGRGTYDPTGIQALSEGSAVLTKLNVQLNRLGDEGEKALRDAAKGREGFELII